MVSSKTLKTYKLLTCKDSLINIKLEFETEIKVISFVLQLDSS